MSPGVRDVVHIPTEDRKVSPFGVTEMVLLLRHGSAGGSVHEQTEDVHGLSPTQPQLRLSVGDRGRRLIDGGGPTRRYSGPSPRG